ncbi:MAG: alpha/beta hydrolase family protein [Planctomycetota bacterium]
MALLHVDFFSEVLGVGASMNVILPQPLSDRAIGVAGGPVATPAHGHPTLWLLHGLSDDHTAWCRRTAIERHVSGLGLAVVMPAVGRSYYADMALGPAYWTFVSEELPAVCRRMFRLSPRREDNFAAGLSMGGYGAFKLALNRPDRFAAAASLSGALDPARLRERFTDRRDEWNQMFGDPPRIAGTPADLFVRAEVLAAGPYADLPLYACCGTDDFIFDNSEAFAAHARRLDLNLTYETHAGEDHEWGYWDQQIARVLDWLPLPPAGGALKR